MARHQLKLADIEADMNDLLFLEPVRSIPINVIDTRRLIGSALFHWDDLLYAVLCNVVFAKFNAFEASPIPSIVIANFVQKYPM